MSQPFTFSGALFKPRNGGCLENSSFPMKKIPKLEWSSERHISRALNKIKKPSTAGEITDLLNRDLEQGDPAFQEKDVADGSQNA
jgi:hypothetical protein